MKKLLLLVIALSLFCPLAFAANSATELFTDTDTDPDIRYYDGSPVRYVAVAFDTTASDLIIYSPATGFSACLIGLDFSETSASNLTIKSGSDTLVTLELGANQGTWGSAGGVPICTERGEDLIFNVSVAISTMLAKLVEVKTLKVQ